MFSNNAVVRVSLTARKSSSSDSIDLDMDCSIREKGLLEFFSSVYSDSNENFEFEVTDVKILDNPIPHQGNLFP